MPARLKPLTFLDLRPGCPRLLSPAVGAFGGVWMASSLSRLRLFRCSDFHALGHDL